MSNILFDGIDLSFCRFIRQSRLKKYNSNFHGAFWKQGFDCFTSKKQKICVTKPTYFLKSHADKVTGNSF